MDIIQVHLGCSRVYDHHRQLFHTGHTFVDMYSLLLENHKRVVHKGNCCKAMEARISWRIDIILDFSLPAEGQNEMIG
jgi:hypothetical protein